MKAPTGHGLAFALLLLLLAAPTVPRAADTAPSLALSDARAVRGTAGVLLRVSAGYPRDDLVQIPLALQLVVRELEEGTDFLRFELASGAFRGHSEAIRDGLEAGNVGEVLAAASPSPAARLVALRPGHIEVLLPPDFPAGPAEVQLLFVYQGEPLFSNPLVVELPAVGDAP